MFLGASAWNNSPMFKFQPILILTVLLCSEALAQDQFQGIKCGIDISKALVGKKTSNQPVAAIQQLHKDLSLKNLGGSEISDHLFLESWSICGTEFELLATSGSGLIRDALSFPAHSTTAPEFIGECQINGKKLSGTVVALLDNSAGYKAKDSLQSNTMLKAKSAWKIDEAQQRFQTQSIGGLSCPIADIVTADGGP